MPKFENKYCYCVWEDGLKGKKVFFSDYITKLKWRVEKNDLRYVDTVVDNYSENCPFHMKEAGFYSFCYYDPNYETKLAYEQGKKIECKRKGDAWGDSDWDYTPSPAWLDDHEYRIQSEENIVTNRELARWLVQGDGELLFPELERCCTNFNYDDDKRNKPVDTRFLVRRWEDEEWHKPTREYMGLED